MSALDDGHFPLDPAEQEKLLSGQRECTFIWNTREGWPVGATMGYLWQDGKIWVTCGGGRPRVRAVKRNDKVCVVISEQRPNNVDVAVTIKGRCRFTMTAQPSDGFLTRSRAGHFPMTKLPARAWSRCSIHLPAWSCA
jgi:hypothetical protein